MTVTSKQYPNSRRWGEVTMATGGLVKFSAPPDDFEEVKAALAKATYVELPTTDQLIAHGGYGLYSRYEIEQQDYAGGHGGYFEVLEIKNPPEGRHPIVLYEEFGRQINGFSEWESLKEAKAAFRAYGGLQFDRNMLFEKPGFIRFVPCGGLYPWFYAVGNQILIGDYAFPEDMQDDPVYRIGEKFVVYDEHDCPTVKTCLGTRIVFCGERYERYSGQKVETTTYRLVHFDDGSLLRLHEDGSIVQTNPNRWEPLPPPRRLVADELWITEAIAKFAELLTGREESFIIPFADGTQFVGRIKNRRRIAKSHPAGTYFGYVTVKGERSPREGNFDFEPTDELPRVEDFLLHRIEKDGKEVTYMCFYKKRNQADYGRKKKWQGVFFKK